VQQTRRTFEVDAAGGAVYRRYDAAGFPDDFLPTVHAVMQWAPVPERFAWVLTENYGQRSIDANDSLVPPDREYLNVTGTGPDLRLGLGEGSWLTSAARFSKVDFEESPFDNERLAGRVSYEQEIGSGQRWSANFTHARTEFTGTPEPFRIHTAHAGYVAVGARGALDANAGFTTLHNETESHDGYFADIRLERQLSGQTAISVDFVHRFADAADVFRRRQDLETDIDSSEDVLASADPLRETAVNVTYSWAGRRTRTAIGAWYFDEDSQGESSANRSGTGALLLGEMNLRPTLRIESRIEWRRESTTLDIPVRLAQGRFNVVWQFARTLGLSLGVEHYLRYGTRESDYDESRFLAFVAWDMKAFDPRLIRTSPDSRRITRPQRTF
jgi:hypothetical protein